MEVRWQYLIPSEFEKLVKEEKVCLLPIGCLERHGEHMPYGTDTILAHNVSVRAAQLEPCVVFPEYYFGLSHGSACYTGTISVPNQLLFGMLENLVDEIARNGFKKIIIVNGHGGNDIFLRYFMMEQINRKVDYTLYYTNFYQGDRYNQLDIWEAPGGGHADEEETSWIMAVAPESVHMEHIPFEEPIGEPTKLAHLKYVHTPLWWYDLYPEHTSGTPSAATREKGEKALDTLAHDLAERIRAIKEDTAVPALQQEFYSRMDMVKKAEKEFRAKLKDE